MDGMTNPQLRIRVAETMGYGPCKPCLANGYTGLWRNLTDTGCMSTDQLPDFDTDANAALLLVARLKEQGWRWEGHETPSGEVFFQFIRLFTIHSGKAATLAEAICLAFIKATQGETKL